MINISLFFKTFSNFAVFFLLFAAGSAWAYYCFKKGKGNLLAPAIIVSGLLLVAWGLVAGIDVDEVEHLHCSWMAYSGSIPFKDFWQHHAPVLWIVLAPFFGLLKPSASLLFLSRIFSGFLFILIVFAGWKAARKAWKEQASLSLYLLIVLGSSILGEFLCLRPDLFTTLFLLVFIYYTLDIPGERVSPSFFAGVFFSLAASFLFKQYLLFFLPLLIILREKKALSVAKAGAYLGGTCFGALPLILYLLDKGIVGEFIFWVFSYNRKRIIFSAEFPIAVGLAGVWGAWLLLRRYRAHRDSGAFILLAAFCLSSLSSLTHTLFPFYSYNIGLWFILCAVIGSGLSLKSLTIWLPSLFQRSLALGLFLSLILSPNVTALSLHKGTYFNDDKKVISELLKYSSQDTCLVILPYHPIFAADACRLYSFWQFYLSGDYPEITKDIAGEGLVEKIRRQKPSVALCILDGRYFLRELFQKGLISKDDFYDLNAFFASGYTVKNIGRNKYFIRNDKFKKFSE